MPPKCHYPKHTPQRYTCFPLSKTDNFSYCDTSPRVSFPFPFSSFFFRSLSFSLLFSIPVTFDRETNPSRHERFHGTSSVFLLRGYLFRFRSSAAHAIPCQSQGSARLNATSGAIDEEVNKMWSASSPSMTPERN